MRGAELSPALIGLHPRCENAVPARFRQGTDDLPVSAAGLAFVRHSRRAGGASRQSADRPLHRTRSERRQVAESAVCSFKIAARGGGLLGGGARYPAGNVRGGTGVFWPSAAPDV